MYKLNTPGVAGKLTQGELWDTSKKYYKEKKTMIKGVSFTSTSAKMKCMLPFPLRDVIKISVKSLCTANPFLRITAYNSLFHIAYADNFTGTSVTESALTHVLHLVRMDTYTPEQLIEELNTLLRKTGSVDTLGRIFFTYDSNTKKVTIHNNHPTRGIWFPSKTSFDSFKNTNGLFDQAETLLPILGFPVNATFPLEIRSASMISGSHGVTETYSTPYNALNIVSSDINTTWNTGPLTPAIETAVGGVAHMVSPLPIGAPYETGSATSANWTQGDLQLGTSLNAFSGAKCMYLVAPEIATGHTNASVKQLGMTGKGRVINQGENVHISGILAKIPVAGGPGSYLTGFSATDIDISDSPMNRLQAISLKLVDEFGSLVDLRGYNISVTLEITVATY